MFCSYEKLITADDLDLISESLEKLVKSWREKKTFSLKLNVLVMVGVKNFKEEVNFKEVKKYHFMFERSW